MSTDFLASMTATSRERVALARRDEPLGALRRRALAAPPPIPIELGSFGLLAEVKLASPSLPASPAAPQIAERVRAYVAGGACAISVLTEPTRFAGSLAHLRDAVQHAGRVPVMRKDFVVDPYQVLEARAAGAAGVLLIAELLDDRQLLACLRDARDLGMFVLLEGFGPAAIERALTHATDPDATAPVLCGVNCRDLRTLSIDPLRFATAGGAGRATIAESGLRSASDVEAVARLGYRGALVGSALVQSSDPASLVQQMSLAGRRGRCASV